MNYHLYTNEWMIEEIEGALAEKGYNPTQVTISCGFNKFLNPKGGLSYQPFFIYNFREEGTLRHFKASLTADGTIEIEYCGEEESPLKGIPV